MSLWKKTYASVVFGTILLGGGYLYFYYLIDGNLYNPVISYRDGIKQYDLQIDGAKFCPGDTPKIETSFCKNRPAIGTAQYFLVNGTYNSLPARPASELPVGCYPADPAKTLTFSAPPIPADTEPGWYHYAGVSRQTISGGRQRVLEFSTEWLEVVECKHGKI